MKRPTALLALGFQEGNTAADEHALCRSVGFSKEPFHNASSQHRNARRSRRRRFEFGVTFRSLAAVSPRCASGKGGSSGKQQRQRESTSPLHQIRFECESRQTAVSEAPRNSHPESKSTRARENSIQYEADHAFPDQSAFELFV
jgi:hypothetical protein